MAQGSIAESGNKPEHSVSVVSGPSAADIVAIVRATNGSEFVVSGSEAELLVKLFASAAATDAAVKATEEASKLMDASFDKAATRAVVVGDHSPELSQGAA